MNLTDLKNYIKTNRLWIIITFKDALITFWGFLNFSGVLTQIQESEVCDLTDWVELTGDCCCRHCFRVKFFALTMDGKITSSRFLYDRNMDMNFYGQQMLLLNSLYFPRFQFY